jgi:hypothetical protein
LNNLVPKILGDGATFRIHPYAGKKDLQDNLLSRLRGYRSWIKPDWYIVVLIDRDKQDCHELKAELEDIASDAGFITKSIAGPGKPFEVMNRLAIEELEAWFFGDNEALVAAYPGIPAALNQKAKYRNPDNITGGTWEALEKVLNKARYHLGGLKKIEAARLISQHMNPERNTSKSFQVFRDGLLSLSRHLD